MSYNKKYIAIFSLFCIETGSEGRLSNEYHKEIRKFHREVAYEIWKKSSQ